MLSNIVFTFLIVFHMEQSLIDVGFLYPVIDKKIYVGQRGTEPYKSLYGPIGGKSEVHNSNDMPYIKDYPAKPHIPYSDMIAKARNKEFGHASAIREFYEEVFQMKEAVLDEISDIFKIGSIMDSFNDKSTNCQFYLANVQRNTFNLSPRELTDMQPLANVSSADLFPLAKVSLYALKYVFEKNIIKKLHPYEDLLLHKQIPDFDLNEIKSIMKTKSTTIDHLITLL